MSDRPVSGAGIKNSPLEYPNQLDLKFIRTGPLQRRTRCEVGPVRTCPNVGACSMSFGEPTFGWGLGRAMLEPPTRSFASETETVLRVGRRPFRGTCRPADGYDAAPLSFEGSRSISNRSTSAFRKSRYARKSERAIEILARESRRSRQFRNIVMRAYGLRQRFDGQVQIVASECRRERPSRRLRDQPRCLRGGMARSSRSDAIPKRVAL